MKIEMFEKESISNVNQDSLTALKTYQLNLMKDESLDLRISNWDMLYASTDANFKFGEKQMISTSDYSFYFDYRELLKNDKLSIPEELNVLNAKSNSRDLKSLMNFSFSKYALNEGYLLTSWWRHYVTEKGVLYSWNDENPENYLMETDIDGERLDDRMFTIFHNLMQNKIAREIIYESIKLNINLINEEISVFQKRLLLKDIQLLISFCENYSLNRKKYLNGRLSVSSKQGVYDSFENYGYQSPNEGFLFRRIEFDGVPPLELAQFFKELKQTIIQTIGTSRINSGMSCEIEGGLLKINSYANSKNQIGFLLRSNSNTYFVPKERITITRLQVKGKNFWRVNYYQQTDFITLDENLKPI
jgi:hypothetical protein